MKIKKKIFNKNLLILFLVAICLFLSYFYFAKSRKQSSLFSLHTYDEKTEFIKVKGVDDGDTIVLENGDTVRYLGIDTPETNHPTIGEECGGKEATQENKRLVLGKKVRLIKDKSNKDNYGRLLRYVFTEDGYFVNYELLKRGLAQILEMSSDNLFKHTFLDAQNFAFQKKLGIWRKCFNQKVGDKK